MGETTFETQWEWLNGKSKSEVTRETQLKWIETEDGSLLRADSVVAIYPKKTYIPNAQKQDESLRNLSINVVCIQVGNCTYRFKEYSCDEADKIMRRDINTLKNIIDIGTWTSDTLKVSDI